MELVTQILNKKVMKKLVILLVGLIFSSCAKSEETEDLFFSEFVKNEATYQNQEIVMPRSSLSEPISLREQLDRLIGERVYTKATMIQSYSGGMEYFTYKNVDDVLNQDPILLSYVKVGNELRRKQWEINTSFYLSFLDDANKEGTVVVHCRPRGFLNTTIYTRTSVMIMSNNSEDDLKTYESKSAPKVLSYLAAFDVKDMTEELARYEEVYNSTVKKYNQDIPLDKIETQCLEGVREFGELSYILDYGEWLYNNERYYDSYIHLLPAFETIKKWVTPNSTDYFDLLSDISAKLGMSLWMLGNQEAADYFLNLAADGNADLYKPVYNEFLKGGQIDLAENLFVKESNNVTVGVVLSELFGIGQHNVREAICECAGKFTTLKTSADVWGFDLKKLCTPKTCGITIAYSRAHYDGDNQMDKSILCSDNNIIITSSKVDDEKWRVNIMIPKFRLHDWKDPGQETNTPTTLSFILGNSPLENFDGKKGGDDYLVKNYEYGLKLKSERRFIESLIVLTNLHKDIERQTYNDESLKKELKRLHSATLFNIGYIFADFNIMQKSITFLNRSIEQNLAYENLGEYISMLSNYTDPRAYFVIKEGLESSFADNEGFELLLNRRLAFLLIDYKMYDEAEEILNKLLENPKTAEFAKWELMYLKSLKGK